MIPLLAEGGEESQCGWLKDRYGLFWQIVPTALLALNADPDRDRAARAFQAMMPIKRSTWPRSCGPTDLDGNWSDHLTSPGRFGTVRT